MSQESHFYSLLKTVDRKKGLRDLRPFPVGEKFGLSLTHPISNQTSGILG